MLFWNSTVKCFMGVKDSLQASARLLILLALGSVIPAYANTVNPDGS